MKNIRGSMYRMLIALFLTSFASSFVTYVYANDEYCQKTCCEPEYDCGCPLNCGSLNVWLRAGVAPLSWRDRGNFSAVSCNSLATSFGRNIVPILNPMPPFKSFFHLPWIVGGQIGYAMTDNFEFYVAFNYRSASRRRFIQPNNPIPNENVTVAFTFSDDYRAFDAYVGGRMYWGRYWCDRVALFLGAQFGLVHHNSVCFDFTISPTLCSTSLPLTSTATTPFFFRNTRPAAGLNLGFDWCLGCGWSLMFMGELIASCGPKSNGNILISNNCTQLPAILPTNLIIGGTGTELFFPVTVGFKYSF